MSLRDQSCYQGRGCFVLIESPFLQRSYASSWGKACNNFVCRSRKTEANSGVVQCTPAGTILWNCNYALLASSDPNPWFGSGNLYFYIIIIFIKYFLCWKIANIITPKNMHFFKAPNDPDFKIVLHKRGQQRQGEDQLQSQGKVLSLCK